VSDQRTDDAPTTHRRRTDDALSGPSASVGDPVALVVAYPRFVATV
jgi:hypothetical protein